MTKLPYDRFLKQKIVAAGAFGTKIPREKLNPLLLPHQADIVQWSVQGGRRAIFASFGLGKTVMQLEIARLVMEITGKPFLICMPLGVVGEFRDDNAFLKTGYEIKYITDTDSITQAELAIYVTNYERPAGHTISPAWSAEPYTFILLHHSSHTPVPPKV